MGRTENRVIEVLLEQLAALKQRNSELRQPQFRLRALGFCGVDDSVPLERLAEESRAHPWVEWAVLFREEMQGQPRFASWEWVKKLGQLHFDSGRKMLLAGHLCSSHIDELFEGDASFVKKLHSEYGFGRVQINATAANGVDIGKLQKKEVILNIVKVITSTPELEFIVQRNDETEPLWQYLLVNPPITNNVSYLFDESKGTGVISEGYPTQPANVKVGYAGGLGPTNLTAQIKKMQIAAPGRSIWCDMESSLRTIVKKDGKEEDICDMDKILSCMQQVIALGLGA